MSGNQASHFFQIVSKRYERGSMILTIYGNVQGWTYRH
jgi:DNA replication protein DnaC